MKILYLSCHSILEMEEVSMFHGLGYDVLSVGSYLDPDNSQDDMRPPIPGFHPDRELIDKYHALGAEHEGEDARLHLTKEFVDNFDVIIVMHIPEWITANWEQIKHKRVIWRTIGQSVSALEASLTHCKAEGLEVVRYSPMEANIPGFIGQDGLIRFYKDPDLYKDWRGTQKKVMTLAQSMKERDSACNYTFFEEVTRPFPRTLYGVNSEDLSFGAGKIPFHELLDAMRNNRVYFYTGTHPASYTLNFIEAWMTGIPIVAIGAEKGNAHYFPGHDLYEIPHLIENGVNGFISNDADALAEYISQLLVDDALASVISINGRNSAISHFGKEMISLAWKEYLDE
jgi:hypothetical protein